MFFLQIGLETTLTVHNLNKTSINITKKLPSTNLTLQYDAKVTYHVTLSNSCDLTQTPQYEKPVSRLLARNLKKLRNLSMLEITSSKLEGNPKNQAIYY
jgi:hypothetical protein